MEIVKLIHDILLWIHIPFGTLSLILFWIPVGVKKGSPLHRKVGRYYFYAMWVVVISAFLLCLSNIILGNMTSALFLGYLSIITANPLWYADEILKQRKVWTDRYFHTRRTFAIITCVCGIAMACTGIFIFKFQNMGTVLTFFGLIGIPAGKDALMKKEVAMDKESRMKMHISGTIITGIAAYTAFFAFGGAKIFQLPPQFMFIPWIAPTILGVIYMRYMTKKYNAV